MAFPQEDGYDTAAILRLAQSSGSPSREMPYRPRPLDGAPALCSGAVAIRQAPERGMISEKFLPARVDHPNLAIGAALLECWPAAYAQFRRLVDTVYPYTDPAHAAQGEWLLGSSSHSYEEDFGSVYATVDNVFGLAQALVHEMAHQKLRAMGVSRRKVLRFLADNDEQGSIASELHEQYSFIHVTALDLHMVAKGKMEWERQCALMLLARNVPRLHEGHTRLARNVQPDADGRLFIDAFLAWSEDILEEGQALLDANGYGFPRLPVD